MAGLRLTTAGESHGPYEVCVVEGIPAGLSLNTADIDAELARRQQGYGRGGRMAIELDRCEFAAGVRLGLTLGSPIAMLVANRDHANWTEVMQSGARESESAQSRAQETVPRPGHADFAGMAKYGLTEIRSVLERASARETVARVAGGAVCKAFLSELGVTVRGRVVSLGGVASCVDGVDYRFAESVDWEAAEGSRVGCDDPVAGDAMCAAIDRAREMGDSLGGVFEIWCWGLCPGLGSYSSFCERLDGRLLGVLGSIPAVKGVEVGQAFTNAELAGSQVHDAFCVSGSAKRQWVSRSTNRAAGLEGGITNGMPVVLRAAMKPIPTLAMPLPSVDLRSMGSVFAHVERSDITAVPAARVVGEAMVAYVLAGAYLDKFGGDSMRDLLASLSAYTTELEARGLWRRS